MGATDLLRVGVRAAALAAAPASLPAWLLLAALMLALPSGARAEPAFTPAPCPFDAELSPAERARLACGTLLVPESRGGGPTRTLSLAVAVVSAAGPERRDDPVLYLQGGPGAGAVARYRAFLDAGMGRGRDIVLMDQRGSGLSGPPLCPFVGEAEVATASILFCRAQLADEGGDPTAYHARAIAADAGDLRRALGIARWNLHAASYGAVVALALMQADPLGVRAVVLDSPDSPLATDADAFAALAGALSGAAEACRAEPACAAAYPDPWGDLTRALDQLDAWPLPLPSFGPAGGDARPPAVDAVTFVRLLALLLREPGGPQLLPAVLHAAARREEAMLAPVLELAAGGRGRGAGAEDGIAAGQHLLVRCVERYRATRPEDYAAVAARWPLLYARWVVDEGAAEVCRDEELFGGVPAPAFPDASPVPTLILSGEFDPVTSPPLAEEMAWRLGRAHYLLLPGGTHGVGPGSDCADRLAAAFLDAPDTAPVPDCLVPRPAFVTGLWVVPGLRSLVRATLHGRDPALAAAAALLPLALAGAALLSALSLRRAGGRAAAALSLAAALAGLASVAGLAAAVMDAVAANPILPMFGLPAAWRPLALLPWLSVLLAVAAVAALRAGRPGAAGLAGTALSAAGGGAALAFAAAFGMAA